jgi:hypothetical protein
MTQPEMGKCPHRQVAVVAAGRPTYPALDNGTAKRVILQPTARALHAPPRSPPNCGVAWESEQWLDRQVIQAARWGVRKTLLTMEEERSPQRDEAWWGIVLTGIATAVGVILTVSGLVTPLARTILEAATAGIAIGYVLRWLITRQAKSTFPWIVPSIAASCVCALLIIPMVQATSSGEASHSTAAGAAEPAPQATIRSVTEGQLVPLRLVVKGSIANIHQGFTPWLIVASSDGYYPQTVVHALADGTWAETATFGSASSSGHTFTLSVVLVDSEGNRRFLNWKSVGLKTGTYSAMTDGVDYPTTTRLYQVPVVRQ